MSGPPPPLDLATERRATAWRLARAIADEVDWDGELSDLHIAVLADYLARLRRLHTDLRDALYGEAAE